MAHNEARAPARSESIAVVSHHRHGRGTPLASLWFADAHISRRNVNLVFAHTSDVSSLRHLWSCEYVLFDSVNALRFGIGGLLYFLASILRKPLAVYWHETEWETERALRFHSGSTVIGFRNPFAIRHMVRNKAVFHFHVSQHGCRMLNERLHINSERITHLRNCSNAELVKQHADVPVQPKRRFVGLGRCCDRKGTDLFVDIAKAYASRCSDVSFVWLGGFGEGEFSRTALDQRVCEAGLAEHVEFRGHVSNAYEVMQASESVVICSRDEPSSKVAQEALGLGLHVVAFDVGGTREVLGDVADLVDYGDVSTFAETLRLPLDRKYDAAMVRRRRARYARHFTPEAFARRFESAFDAWKRFSGSRRVASGRGSGCSRGRRVR